MLSTKEIKKNAGGNQVEGKIQDTREALGKSGEKERTSYGKGSICFLGITYIRGEGDQRWSTGRSVAK